MCSCWLLLQQASQSAMAVCSQPCLSYCISCKENAMNHTQNSWHQHTGSLQWHLEQGLDKAPKHLLQILSSKEHAKCFDTHQANWSQNQKRFQFNFLPWEIVFVEPSKTSSSNMFFSFCFWLCCSDLRVPCLRVTIQHTNVVEISLLYFMCSRDSMYKVMGITESLMFFWEI